MRFLFDESTDARLAAYLNSLGHDATLVAQVHRPGIPDKQVLETARAGGRILVTDDRDFGELVFRQRQPHTGVIYFRLRDTLLSNRITRLFAVLTRYPEQIDEFVVVTDHRIRPRR
jgi:predicted nuclease of predicted toxin-antitoxin system